MRLYDEKGNVYIAHAEKRPQFRAGVFGRTWDYETKTIDGVDVQMTWDTTWGNWYHFFWNGRYYRLRIFVTYNSDELAAGEVTKLFTNKKGDAQCGNVFPNEKHPNIEALRRH